MILLCGIPSEEPLRLVREALERLNLRYALFNQRQFRTVEFAFEIADGEVGGSITLQGRRIALDQIRGVYLRLMDDQFLPELRGEPAQSRARLYCRGLHEALSRWCEIAPGRVLNRLAPMASNSSKPYQAQLIRQHGLEVPETLITDDPELVLAFRERHQRIIYKSISGVRSIVRTFSEDDLSRLERIRWCPTQFQEFVPGTNVRVHTVGPAVFATAVATDATDYRYASRQVGEAAELSPYTLPGEIAEKCVRLSAGLGLDFAGIDLKVTPDGRVFCFEVNPCPAFSYYELHTGQPISLAVARYLAGLN